MCDIYYQFVKSIFDFKNFIDEVLVEFSDLYFVGVFVINSVFILIGNLVFDVINVEDYFDEDVWCDLIFVSYVLCYFFRMV